MDNFDLRRLDLGKRGERVVVFLIESRNKDGYQGRFRAGNTIDFVEIMNTSGSAVSLTGWTLELVSGSGGGAAIYNTIDLPDVSLSAGDYFGGNA